MASYDDMCNDANGIMYLGKYKGSENDAEADFKKWNFGFKAAPKSTVSIAHSWTQNAKYDAKEKCDKESVKSATKLGMKHDDLKWDIAAANDKYSVKVSSPLVKDDWKVKGSLMWEEKPGNTKKIEACAEIESPDMSGATIVSNLTVEQELDKEYKTAKPVIKFDANVNVEKDYNIGFAVEHDTADLKGCDAAVSKVDGVNKYWLGYDHSNQFAKLGCLIHYSDKSFTHAYEARYGLGADAKKRFQDLPLTVAAGGKYALSGQTSMSYAAEFGAATHGQAKFEHKIDKNWKVSAHQSFDCNKNNLYRTGFDVNYTL